MKKLLSAFLILLAFAGSVARADIVVLVHGYLGSPMSWQTSGVNDKLMQAGWKKSGIIFERQRKILLTQMPQPVNDHQVYSVRLPSRAPLTAQSNLLQAMLSDLGKRHPDEKITLVGHSAGGVVARLTLVRFGAGNVDQLITIASPHLGTGMAVYALNETNDSGPVGFIKSFFGGSTYHTVRSSTGILLDLVPVRPGTLLYWLNNQPHPDIEYISIVRGQNIQFNGDQIIPGFSQDMNQVPALKGKSQVYFVKSGHQLNPVDGDTLSILLEKRY